MICLLIGFGACLLSGCATSGQDSVPSSQTTPVDGMDGVVKQVPSPTADLDPVEKTGYYLGWLSLEMRYGMAGQSYTP